MSARAGIVVVGCGSAAGDDAAGLAALARLRAEGGLPAGVRLHAAGGGDALLDVVGDAAALVLVDAVASGAPPGTLHRWRWPSARLDGLRAGSTHQLGPAAALALADALGLLPPEVVALGVEVDGTRAGDGLGAAVAAALPALVAAVRAEVCRLARA
jgi:hydrogenase maturation protease